MTSQAQGAVPPPSPPSSRLGKLLKWEGWKPLGASATAVVAVVGAVVAWQTFRVSSQTLKANTLQQASDRFDKAIEHLGSENRDVRLGGIYALDKLAWDTPSEHSEVFNVLTSFVRGHAVVGKDICSDAGAPGGVPNSPAPTASPLVDPTAPAPSSLGSIGPRPAEDIQTVIYVVGRRNRKYDAGNESVDFSHTCLRGASFKAETEADYSDISMNSADLRSANLGKSKLERAFMYGATLDDAVIVEAKLRNAHLDYARMWRAGLTGADLREAHMAHADLRRANLCNADLSGADLSDANLADIVYNSATKWPSSVQPPPSRQSPC